MKIIKNLILFFLIGSLSLLSSCVKDSFAVDDETTEEIGEGQVSLAMLKLDVDEKVTTRGDVNTDNYIIRIFSAKNNLQVKEYPKLSEMPEILTLEVGDYRVEALSHEVAPAEWEKPYYKGSQTFTIKKDEVVTINDIPCSLQNIMVKVSLNDDLKTLVDGAQSVTVTIGSGSLIYSAKDIEDGRAGYFEAAEVGNILVATFQGKVDGEPTTMIKSEPNVKGGEGKNVIFKVEIPSVGDASMKLKLDAVCKDIDFTTLVKPGDEVILPEDPSVNPGPANAPTITGEGFNIVDEIEVEKDETKTIIVNIAADNGIQNLKVKIDSETLTPEILNAVGLSSEFDLANPGSADLETALKGLGFPVGSEVIGVKTLVFDITNFTPLLGLYGLASHNFIITVIDQAGNTKTATLALKSVAKR